MKKYLILISLICFISCQKELEWTDLERRDNVNTSLGCVTPKFRQDAGIIGHETSNRQGYMYIFPSDKSQGPFTVSLDGGKTFLPSTYIPNTLCAIVDPNGNFSIGPIPPADYEVCIKSKQGCVSTIFKAKLERR